MSSNKDANKYLVDFMVFKNTGACIGSGNTVIDSLLLTEAVIQEIRQLTLDAAKAHNNEAENIVFTNIFRLEQDSQT